MTRQRPDGAQSHPCLCFNLRKAARRVSAFYDAYLAKAGLTSAQLTLLAEAAAGTGTPISQLAGGLGLDPSTLSRTLRPLEADRLIEIVPEPSNRRLRRVRLTLEGRGRLRDGLSAWREAQAAAASVIPEGLVLELLAASERLPETTNPGRPKRQRPGLEAD